MFTSLLQRRVIYLSGKGGTGKTSVAVAIARLLRDRGQRVLLLENGESRPALSQYFPGASIGYEPVEAEKSLFVANIDFLSAMEGFLKEVVPMGKLVGAILSNKVVRYFLNATPGARELVLLSRMAYLERATGRDGKPLYDVAIIDLPASGHTLSLFGTMEVVHKVFTRGPLRTRGDELRAWLGNSEHSALAMVAIPEEMSVNETLESMTALERIGYPKVEGVFLNRFPEPLLGDREGSLVDELLQGEVAGVLRPMVEAAARRFRRQQAAEQSLIRLRDEGGRKVVALPDYEGDATAVARLLTSELGDLLESELALEEQV